MPMRVFTAKSILPLLLLSLSKLAGRYQQIEGSAASWCTQYCWLRAHLH
jgi:hypothetical protein